MLWDCAVHKFPMAGPDDVSALATLIDAGAIKADEIICVIAKTEGNGRVNDFSRPFAHRVFRDFLSERTGRSLEETDRRVAFVMSGGCEGVLSPHATVFTRRAEHAARPSGSKKLTLGMASTRIPRPEEIGTITQVQLVADAVRQAVKEAEIASLEDVHYVQVKCPLLTSERINDARQRGFKTVTEDTLRSMGYSNGSSALGIALGLGEVKEIDPSVICTRADIYTTRGGASAGIELMNARSSFSVIPIRRLVPI